MKHHRILNYRLLLLATSTVGLSAGLFVPFYIVFIQNFGKSIQSFGLAVGLMALAESITAYFIGRHSDVLGRKTFLIIAEFATGAIIIAYTFITSLMQLYVLQVIFGIMQAMEMTMVMTLLADVTEKSTRGADVGKYRAVTGVMGAFAMMGGGYLAGELGIKIIFYVAAALMFIAGLVVFYIKEE
jgi:MFS family permease